jgi:hypothetical protein
LATTSLSSLRFPWVATLLGVGTALLAALALGETDGHWVYPLDDSYIHLSLARELAAHGHWGFGPERTAFSSSSPGYTLLLALGSWFTGPWAGWPLLLNGLGGLLLMRQSWRLWPESHAKIPLWLLLMGLLPFPLLVLLGLEHLLHLWAMLGLMQALSRLLAREAPGRYWWLWALAAAALRYESAFLIGSAGLALLWQRQGRPAWQLGLAGAAVPFLVGLWSVSQGGTWLPLSLLIKGHAPDGLAWLGQGVERLYANPFMLTTLVALCLGLLPALRRHLPPARDLANHQWLWLTLAAGLAHLWFAEVGGYRYEAYWLGLALVGLGQLMPPRLSWRQGSLPGIALVALLLFPLLIRSGFFLWHYPQATRNIYQQPYQTAQWLGTYYRGEPVGLNDIGLATYLGQVELTDMVGVGDQAVCELRQANRFTAAELDRLLLARGVSLIIGHHTWLGARMPERFYPVATRTVPDNFILAQDTLTFWVADSAAEVRLQQALPALRHPPGHL